MDYKKLYYTIVAALSFFGLFTSIVLMFIFIMLSLPPYTISGGFDYLPSLPLIILTIMFGSSFYYHYSRLFISGVNSKFDKNGSNMQ